MQYDIEKSPSQCQQCADTAPQQLLCLCVLQQYCSIILDIMTMQDNYSSLFEHSMWNIGWGLFLGTVQIARLSYSNLIDISVENFAYALRGH